MAKNDSATSTTPPERTEHPYYMYESIHDMPRVLELCLQDDALAALREIAEAIRSHGARRVFLVGCGTSMNIARAVATAVEQRAGLPARAIDSLEFMLYPPPDVDSEAAVIAISHSGNSLVTVQAAEWARQRGAYVVGMVGNPQGKLASAGDVTLLDPGGIELNGPKIRSYIVSCFQGYLLALMLQELATGASLLPQVRGIPAAAGQLIQEIEPKARDLAYAWAHRVSSYMVIGSGSDAGNAAEIALKILETVPPPANGFDVEEYTHGPIFATQPERGLIVLQGVAPGRKRCIEAANATHAISNNILVVTDDPGAGWPEGVVVGPIPADLRDAGFLLSPMPAQLVVYYLCLALDKNADHASTRSSQTLELWRRAFPPGTH
jgi:fructoselysine-6-P-deglycase FrlB-like protein